MVLAWHVAMLGRTKKMPPLKKLMTKAGTSRKQTWQQQQAIMDQWVAHTNRVVKRKKGHGK